MDPIASGRLDIRFSLMLKSVKLESFAPKAAGRLERKLDPKAMSMREVRSVSTQRLRAKE